jgi:hypothetical protein
MDNEKFEKAFKLLCEAMHIPDDINIIEIAEILQKDKSMDPMEFADCITKSHLTPREQMIACMSKTYMMLSQMDIPPCKPGDMVTASGNILNMLNGWPIDKIISLMVGVLTISSLGVANRDPIHASRIVMACSDLMAMASTKILEQKHGYTLDDLFKDDNTGFNMDNVKKHAKS